MKIIGKTASGYIVETSDSEFAEALGFSSTYSDDWRKFKNKHTNGCSSDLQIGTVVEVAKGNSFFRDLMYREKQARDAAGFLHSLADMITTSLPTLIVGPAAEPEKPE